MLKLGGEGSRFIGFIASMLFSAAVIFGCSFGMVGMFQSISEYGLDGLSEMSNGNVDAMVATITGISIDEEAMEGAIVDEMTNIIYSFENQEDYTFADATSDAGNILTIVFEGFGLDDVTDTFGTMVDSVLGMFDNSGSVSDLMSEEAVKGYVDEYLGGAK